MRSVIEKIWASEKNTEETFMRLRRLGLTQNLDNGEVEKGENSPFWSRRLLIFFEKYCRLITTPPL